MKLRLVREYIFKRHATSSVCDPVEVNTGALRRLAIFPRIGVLYNRVKKNANSTTMVALSGLENGVLLDSNPAKMSAVQWHHLQVQFMDLSRFKRLLIVRDPYTRTLSAFRQKFGQQKYRNRWRDFELSQRGYLDFLLWLKDGGLNGDAHWDLQMKSIVFPLKSYSHIIRFENLEASLFDFLRQCNTAISEEYFLESSRKGSMHATGSSGVVEQFYSKESFRLVSELFEQDFMSLGYPFRS